MVDQLAEQLPWIWKCAQKLCNIFFICRGLEKFTIQKNKCVVSAVLPIEPWLDMRASNKEGLQKIFIYIYITRRVGSSVCLKQMLTQKG